MSKRGYAVTDAAGNPIRFYRARPKNSIAAEKHYLAHCEQVRPEQGDPMCHLASEETDWRCPTFYNMDFQSEGRRCLVYATLIDDWKELRAKEGYSYGYTRQWTTSDGEWIRDIPKGLE